MSDINYEAIAKVHDAIYDDAAKSFNESKNACGYVFIKYVGHSISIDMNNVACNSIIQRALLDMYIYAKDDYIPDWFATDEGTVRIEEK